MKVSQFILGVFLLLLIQFSTALADVHKSQNTKVEECTKTIDECMSTCLGHKTTQRSGGPMVNICDQCCQKNPCGPCNEANRT